MKVDFILVGQGLAGTLLAHELFRQNKSFVIFDDPGRGKASDVAAGLINPVVFRRMTKSWLVDEAFPEMEVAYHQLEILLNEKLYFPGRMLKILNEEEVCFWKEKVFANKLEDYLDTEPHLNFENLSCSVGFINKSERLDIQKLILSFSEFVSRMDLLRKEKFEFEELFVYPGTVNYKELTAEKIIFCEGAAASQNPYFKNLKFKHSQGDVLELKIPDLKLNEIISSEVFVLPLDGGLYKVGATYRWDELNGQVTDSGRAELLHKLKNITSAPVQIVNQKAGIRPTMHDRKPVIGLLPGNPRIGIFNGLGSKGVLLGPYFARQLAGYLTGISPYIHPEANISRYFPKK